MPCKARSAVPKSEDNDAKMINAHGDAAEKSIPERKRGGKKKPVTQASRAEDRG